MSQNSGDETRSHLKTNLHFNLALILLLFVSGERYVTFSFGETSNGGIFDRRYFPWWTLLIHTCSSSMRMNREKGREGGRESGLEPTRSVRKMEIVVERIRTFEWRSGFLFWWKETFVFRNAAARSHVRHDTTMTLVASILNIWRIPWPREAIGCFARPCTWHPASRLRDQVVLAHNSSNIIALDVLRMDYGYNRPWRSRH